MGQTVGTENISTSTGRDNISTLWLLITGAGGEMHWLRLFCKEAREASVGRGVLGRTCAHSCLLSRGTETLRGLHAGSLVHRKAVAEDASKPLLFNRSTGEAARSFLATACAEAASTIAGLFPCGRNHPGRQTPPTHFIRFNHLFKMICLMKPHGAGGSRGQVGAVAWGRGVALQRVQGTTWPVKRCKPRGFPFPPGLQAEAPDVAALGRQRRF